jgi:phage terminase Nu1 subunit (DNA packaging protein)
MIFNRVELAELLGVHKTTIDEWVREGMPFKARPDPTRQGERQWKFESAETVEWLVTRAKGSGVGVDDGSKSAAKVEQEAKARERTAIAGLKEMEYAQALKELVHIDDVIERVEEQYAIVKSRVQAIPGRMAQQLAVETEAATVERLLKQEVSECLEALSGAAPA